MFRFTIAFVLALITCSNGALAESVLPTIRIGVLAFGTVNWELAAIENEGLAKAARLRLVPTNLASAEAAKIALRGGTVDIIVADWIWVARQREQGLDFTFSPYSTSHGALMVPPESPIRSIADLKGKKLGVAGGGIDKNWLLLQALAKKKYRLDLAKSADIAFGAPPLLNQELLQGRLNALLNYWHYAAKLEAKGYRLLLDGRAMLRELGIQADLANLGYVFRESWAEKNAGALQAYLDIANQARNRLCAHDADWQKVVSLTRETDAKVTTLLRQRYCDGRIENWGPTEVMAAEQVFALLREAGGPELTGKADRLPRGVFWTSPGR